MNKTLTPTTEYRPPSSTREKRPYFEERPRKSASEREQELLSALGVFITARNGWVTSIPGHLDVRVELPIATAAATVAELDKMKFVVQPEGPGTHLWWGREVPTERFVISLKQKK